MFVNMDIKCNRCYVAENRIVISERESIQVSGMQRLNLTWNNL